MPWALDVDSLTAIFRLRQILDAAKNLTVAADCDMRLQDLRNKPGIAPILTGWPFDDTK